MTAMEGGNAERLSGTISALPVGKASAPAYSQGCDVCRFCMEQKPVTPLTYIPVGKASAPAHAPYLHPCRQKKTQAHF